MRDGIGQPISKSRMVFASFYLPPYSPALQPAETLWALVDEPIVNPHIATITDLDEKIAAQCIALSEQREQIQSRTGFHWWPKRIAPN